MDLELVEYLFDVRAYAELCSRYPELHDHMHLIAGISATSAFVAMFVSIFATWLSSLWCGPAFRGWKTDHRVCGPVFRGLPLRFEGYYVGFDRGDF